MEVVVVAVSEEHEAPNDVNKGFRIDLSSAPIEHSARFNGAKSSSEALTHGGCILPKVTSLISPE